MLQWFTLLLALECCFQGFLSLRKMDTEKMVALGKDMGLSGQDLYCFVKEREQKVAEERAARQNWEREERVKEREHEKEMRELELKLMHEQNSILNDSDSKFGVKPNVPTSLMKSKMPKLPYFNDQKDDMDAYLRRFERFATSMGWPASEWSTSLSALLTGKALEVYSRLSLEQANDYPVVKTSLLHRFQLTEEGFRLKFRNAKPEHGERYSQFVERLHSYLLRWMDLGDTPRTFESLTDLLLREQMLNACGTD